MKISKKIILLKHIKIYWLKRPQLKLNPKYHINKTKISYQLLVLLIATILHGHIINDVTGKRLYRQICYNEMTEVFKNDITMILLAVKQSVNIVNKRNAFQDFSGMNFDINCDVCIHVILKSISNVHVYGHMIEKYVGWTLLYR